MAKHIVPYSLSALLQAPLVILVPAAVLLASGTRFPILAFGMFALMSYVFTLAAVGFLLLPALWVVSWVASIKTWLPPVIGGVLASLIFGVWDYLNWCSSGVDSGPPATTFPQWIAKSSHTPEPFVAILFGVVTGAAYYCLATRKPVQSKEPMP